MGCSGGDTEGELEKKTKRNYGLNHLVAVACLTIGAVAAPLAIVTLNMGISYGYNEGKKEQAAMEEAPKVKMVLDDFGLGHFADISVEQIRDGRKQIYTLSASDSKYATNKDWDIWESLDVERGNGKNVLFVDADAYIQFQEEASCLGRHDGLVDCIVNMKNGRVIGGLCRERDYGANKATFDEADESLKNARKEYT